MEAEATPATPGIPESEEEENINLMSWVHTNVMVQLAAHYGDSEGYGCSQKFAHVDEKAVGNVVRRDGQETTVIGLVKGTCVPLWSSSY